MFFPPAQPRGYQKGKNHENQKAPIVDLNGTNLKFMFDAVINIEQKPKASTSRPANFTGIAQYASLFETVTPLPVEPLETAKERKERMHARLKATNDEKNSLLLSDWNPKANSKATGDAFLTLFVGRLSYDTTEKKLRREFEEFGAIRNVRLVTDLEGKSRGYAFIEFTNEKDLQTAYRRCDGRKIDGRRIIVDVERGRTVPTWRPMRLGGGLGGRLTREERRKRDEKNDPPREQRGNSRDRRDQRDNSRDRNHQDRMQDNRRRNSSRDRERRDRSRSRDRGGERDRFQGGGRGGDRDREQGGERDRYAPPPRGRSREREQREREPERPRNDFNREREPERPRNDFNREREPERPRNDFNREREPERPRNDFNRSYRDDRGGSGSYRR